MAAASCWVTTPPSQPTEVPDNQPFPLQPEFPTHRLDKYNNYWLFNATKFWSDLLNINRLQPMEKYKKEKSIRRVEYVWFSSYRQNEYQLAHSHYW